MAYTQHPALLEPQPPGAKLWRYIDIPKFLSFIHTASLHFARGDRFEDPYEGMLTDRIAKSIKSSNEEVFRMWHQSYVNGRFDTHLNCWHRNEHESAAMWKLYGQRGAGIAIQSTFVSLVESLSDVREPIHIGIVQYGDEHLRSDTIPNGFSVWATKRESFEHERELRAIIWRPRNLVVGTITHKHGELTVTPGPAAKPDTPLSIPVRVKVETLVQQIVLSPDMPDWMSDVIEGVVSKYGYAFPIQRSRLYELSFLET